MATNTNEKKPPFEGTLVYLGGDSGRWIAGFPSRDVTADEWVERGYTEHGNFTPEQLVATGLYEIRPPKTSAKTKKEDAGPTSQNDKKTAGASGNASENTGPTPAPATDKN